MDEEIKPSVLTLRACTCCLTDKCTKDIKTQYSWMGKEEVYEEMLHQTFNISINKDTTAYPICEDCIKRLRDAANFKHQVIENIGYLTRMCVRTDIKIERDATVPDERKRKRSEESHDDEIDRECRVIDDTLKALKRLRSLRQNRQALNVQPDMHTSKQARSKPDNTKPKPLVRTRMSSGITQMSSYLAKVKLKREREQEKTSNAMVEMKDSREKSLDKVSINVSHKLESESAKLRKLRANSLMLLKHSNATLFQFHRNKYKCFCCKEFFDTFKEAKEHLKVHTLEEIRKRIVHSQHTLYFKIEVTDLTCKLCSKSVPNYSLLKSHLNQHNLNIGEDLLIPFKLEDQMECALCSESFTVFHQLNVHMNVHYQNHVCEVCGQGFITKFSLKVHSERHNKTYKCHKCEMIFDTEYQRDLHSVKKHKAAIKRACPHCPERFNNHYARLMHLINVHAYKKPEHKCSFCDKIFVRQFLVKAHIRKFHMQEKNYECSVCPLKFFGLSDMNRHLATHSGEKKYTCACCGKSYARKWTLNDHMKSHRDAEEG